MNPPSIKCCILSIILNDGLVKAVSEVGGTFQPSMNRIKSDIGADGYVYRQTGPFKRFQSRLYSGDVLEAFKKELIGL